MSRRLLGVLCSLLFLTTLALAYYAWRLRAKVDRAEFYVQSGADSVFFICSPVLRAVQERSSSDVDLAMLGIARECVGQVSDDDLESMSNEFKRKDIGAITKRIKVKLDDHEFPYATSSPVESSRLPKSYRN